MKVKNCITYITLFLIALFPLVSNASASQDDKPFNINDLIDGHTGDSHDFHLFDYNGHSYAMPLPIILYTDNGLVTFLSSEFHHDNEGKVVVEKDGQRFVRYKEDIYYANEDGTVAFNEQGKVTNARPLNFSITKNVFSLLLISVLLVVLFTSMARSYKKNPKAPKGMAGLLEPLVLYIRDEIAIPNIGEKYYMRYMPYLLTVFFLIWVANLFGLIPFFPFAATVTNNILFTAVLAVFTLLITLFSSNKNYWKHIFATPGVPPLLLPIMIPIEIIGIFTTVWVSPVSILFSLFISTLELLVAVLQAYVFTLLSALFIGNAVEEEHH